MIRTKTLSLLLASAFIGLSAPAFGQRVQLELSSRKEYRQSKANIHFTGGTFFVHFLDGLIIYGPCTSPVYLAPGEVIGACAPGTSGYVSYGSLEGVPVITRPYLLVTGLIQAVAVEPRQPARVKLVAAPASLLPRPSGGFTDSSVSLYYNLHTTSIAEYTVTQYNFTRTYTAAQRSKFEGEIVPGVYHYSFPRLKKPTMPAGIAAVIYPMIEGLATKNSKTSGFEFTKYNNNNWNAAGFVTLSSRKPNTIAWRPLTTANTFAAVDKMYFSMRPISNQTNPESAVNRNGVSIFPPFANAADSRVLLPNPFTTTFTVPPIFAVGTKGVIEVEVERNFPTGGVTYDFSRRRFQLPFVIVDSYKDYAAVYAGNAPYTADTDADGFNNLTEWILDSAANDATDVPIDPVPELVPAFADPREPAGYFGFRVKRKLATDPSVTYTLQRSTDGGFTWATFVSDANWTVAIDNGFDTTPGTPQYSDILVTSNVPNTQPPGTENDLYRVLITTP